MQMMTGVTDYIDGEIGRKKATNDSVEKSEILAQIRADHCGNSRANSSVKEKKRKIPPVAHTSVLHFAEAHCESATCMSSKMFGDVK